MHLQMIQLQLHWQLHPVPLLGVVCGLAELLLLAAAHDCGACWD
jgi:hypothetical protein